jgi:hypothetical protein
MRTLRGHTGAITALHCVTRKEVWDLVGDREDAGFFISGSTDCTVSLKFMLSYGVFCFFGSLSSLFASLSAIPSFLGAEVPFSIILNSPILPALNSIYINSHIVTCIYNI